MDTIDDPVVLGTNIRKRCFFRWEILPWEGLFVHEKFGLLSVVDDMKMVGKKQNLRPKWSISVSPQKHARATRRKFRAMC